MKNLLRRCACVGALLVLAGLGGCGTLHAPGSAVAQGPGSDFPAQDIQGYVDNQDRVRLQLVAMAQAHANSTAPTLPPGWTEWDRLIDAGMNIADSRCRSYLDALYRFDRQRRTAVTQIGLAGTAAAGLMAATRSAAKEVAMVAILFGLAASTVDNLAGGVLYELPPSVVGSMVTEQQQAFRQTLGRGYGNWPAALSVIQNYAVICVPSHIENEINIAIKNTKAGASPGNPANGQPPAVSNELAALRSGEHGVDTLSQALRDFARSSPANRARLQAYLDKSENGIELVSLLRIGANADARTRAARAMKLIP